MGLRVSASVTQPLPGQIPRAPLIPLASAGLLLPFFASAALLLSYPPPECVPPPPDTCDRYPLTWAAHLQSCSSALCEPSKLAPVLPQALTMLPPQSCPPSSSQHAHFQFHLESHPHGLLSLRVLSLPSGALPATGIDNWCVVRSIHLSRELLLALYSQILKP